MSNDDRVTYLAGDRDPETSLDEATRAELDELRGTLGDPAVWLEPPPGLEDRIVAAVTEAATAAPPPALVPVPAAEPTPVAGGAVATSRRRWVRYAVSGVAAAAVLAIALTITLSQGEHPTEYAAAVTGTKLAPGISGQVTMTKTTSGWRISLHAAGLPRLDNGRYYEAWLKNGAGQLVAIGTFNQGEDVTLWSGVPPTTHPTITVTQQVATDGPASSGQVVLIGSTHQTH